VTTDGLPKVGRVADSGGAVRDRFDEEFVDGLHLGDAIRFFLDAKRAGGRSERTISEYRKKLDLFQRWAAGRLEGEGAVDTPVSWIGPDEVEAYVMHMRERGLSDASIKNHLSVVRSFFDTLSRRLDLPDPTRRLDEVRFHQKAPKRAFLTRREADVLLGAMEKRASGQDAGDAVTEDAANVRAARRREVRRALAARDHAAFSTMIYAGLRIEETTALTVDDLSLARGAEEVRVARGKGNKERLVPMGPTLRRSLRRYLRVRDALIPAGAGANSPLLHLFITEKGRRITEGTLRRRLYMWVRESRLKKANIKPHDLRRTFGTWYLQENPGQLIELAELMGHSNLSQVRKYALSDAERARAGIAKL
jgi:integrase/recombinase XerD